MNKTIFLIALNLLLTGFIIAGDGDKKIKVPFDSTTNKYTYEKIIQVDSLKANSLYLKAKKWYISKYLKSTFLIDSENNTLMQVGVFEISAPIKVFVQTLIQSYKVSYHITSQFKDGKCKLVITDFKIAYSAEETAVSTLETFQKQNGNILGINQGLSGKVYAKHTVLCFEAIDKEIQKIIVEFESNLKGLVKSKSDW